MSLGICRSICRKQASHALDHDSSASRIEVDVIRKDAEIIGTPHRRVRYPFQGGRGGLKKNRMALGSAATADEQEHAYRSEGSCGRLRDGCQLDRIEICGARAAGRFHTDIHRTQGIGVISGDGRGVGAVR